jgi:thioredoxin 1
MSVIELNDENFRPEVTDDSGIVVVDFWAEWCGPCKMMEPIFEQSSEEAAGKAKFGKYNVDGGKTTSEYGIMSIPTIVFFKDGKKVESLSGVQDKDTLMKKIEELTRK